MSDNFKFSVQEILNRVLDTTNSRLRVGASGGYPATFLQAQEVWNRVFDDTAGRERLRMDG